MKTNTSKTFDTQLAKLNSKNQEKAKKAIKKFIKNPFDKDLDNHPLFWKLKWKRAISAGYDLRIVYKESWWHVEILFLKVWTHSQVY